MLVQNFIGHYPHPCLWPRGQGHRLRNFILKVCVIVFKIFSFLNPCMDLLYILLDYIYWSKILFGTIHTPAYDLEVKVIDLEIYFKVLCQIFKISSFLKPCMDLLYIWQDYRYWSKIVSSTIPTLWPRGQGHGLRNFIFKFYFKFHKSLYFLSYFSKRTIHLVYIWYTDSYGSCSSSKIISSTMSPPNVADVFSGINKKKKKMPSVTTLYPWDYLYWLFLA